MTADGPTELGNTARLVSLTVGDDADAWEAAGFTVVDGTVTIGATSVTFAGRAEDRSHRGIQSWTVAGLDAAAGVAAIDGITTSFEAGTDAGAGLGASTTDSSTTDTPTTESTDTGAAHPNGVTGIDHVVILTPDLDRTLAAFGAVGLGVRRIRETESYGAPMRQAFLRLGPTIVEVVGGHEGTGQSVEEAPATFFGLALDVADLDRTAALLGEGMGAIKPAVQDGRRISTIRHKQFGMSVATALMDDRLTHDVNVEAGA